MEDLGEPGSSGLENTAECPPEGSFGELASCECRDFYHIVIYKEFDPATEAPKTDPADIIYEEFGYLDGGNMQLHPPID